MHKKLAAALDNYAAVLGRSGQVRMPLHKRRAQAKQARERIAAVVEELAAGEPDSGAYERGYTEGYAQAELDTDDGYSHGVKAALEALNGVHQASRRGTCIEAVQALLSSAGQDTEDEPQQEPEQRNVQVLGEVKVNPASQVPTQEQIAAALRAPGQEQQ